MWPASPLELDKTLCEQCQPWAFHFHKYLEKMTSFSVYNHSTYWSCDSEKVAINSVKLLSCVQLFVTHGVQHIRFLCLLPVPGTYSNSCPSTRWCYPTISSSVISFSSYLQFFPASGYFPMSLFFTSAGKSKVYPSARDSAEGKVGGVWGREWALTSLLRGWREQGAKESRIRFLSYKEALWRVTHVELKRLKDAFRRTCGLSYHMVQHCFIREVLGDGVPPKVAGW